MNLTKANDNFIFYQLILINLNHYLSIINKNLLIEF